MKGCGIDAREILIQWLHTLPCHAMQLGVGNQEVDAAPISYVNSCKPSTLRSNYHMSVKINKLWLTSLPNEWGGYLSSFGPMLPAR